MIGFVLLYLLVVFAVLTVWSRLCRLTQRAERMAARYWRCRPAVEARRAQERDRRRTTIDEPRRSER